jgi:putative ABC transport system permease protein
LLLLRRPGVAVALLAAALVTVLPAAAAPMFLSSAQHATLHRQIDETCHWQVGFQVDGQLAPAAEFALGPDTVLGAERYHGREAVVAEYPVAGLTDPLSTGYGETNGELTDRPMTFPDLSGLTLLAREGARDQVEVLEGPAGEGLWLPHEHAQLQGIEVGDQMRLSFRGNEPRPWNAPEDDERSFAGAPEPVTLPVAAIYRDLRASPDTGYWCGLADIYRGSEDPNADPPPPMALVDIDTFMTVGETNRMIGRQRIGLAVIDPTLTASEAAALAADIDTLQMTLLQDHGALFPRGFSDNTDIISYLGRYERRAELVRTGLLPPVVPITAAGTLVGLAVAGAAAVFWVQRRRRELTVLAAHGVGAPALGMKAVAEALPAVLVGTVAGWATAWALVAAVGPSPVLTHGTLPLAGAVAAVTGLVALLLIGRLASSGARGLTDARPVTHRRRWWGRVPWELALLAAAPVAWLLLADDQVADPTAGGVGTVVHVPARVLVAPILIIAGLAILAARLATAGLRGRGLGRVPAGPARLLAWRRLVRAAATTAILAAATAVPVAMATFGSAATDSISTTADAQLRFNLGSDTVLSYQRELVGPPPPPVPESMAGRATEVLRLNHQRLGGLIVDVLAVDPDTFTDGAYWDARISGPSLEQAVGQLSTGGTPTVVASRRIPPGPDTLTVGDQPIPVQVVATRPLPGAQAAYPLVIIHQDALRGAVSQEVLSTFGPRVWVAGGPERTEADIATAQLRPSRVVTVDDHRVGSLYEPVTYTFQYLIALSIFTGLIGAVGLLLYLESRTIAHRRAYVMLRRLGLSAGAHRRALLLELGAPVVAGLTAGIAVAVAIAYALRNGFDLDPDRFPDALLALPTGMAVVVAGAAVTIAIGASLLTHARIIRANPGEVLRDAT